MTLASTWAAAARGLPDLVVAHLMGDDCSLLGALCNMLLHLFELCLQLDLYLPFWLKWRTAVLYIYSLHAHN